MRKKLLLFFQLTMTLSSFAIADVSDFGNIMTGNNFWSPYGCQYSSEKDCAGKAKGTMGRERKTWTYFCQDSNKAIKRNELVCTSRVRVTSESILIWHGAHHAVEGERFCFNDQANFYLFGKENTKALIFEGHFLEQSSGPYRRPNYRCLLYEGVNSLFQNTAPSPGVNVVTYEILLKDGRKSLGQFSLDLKEVPIKDVYSGPVQDYSDETCSTELEERICHHSW